MFKFKYKNKFKYKCKNEYMKIYYINIDVDISKYFDLSTKKVEFWQGWSSPLNF